MIKKYTAIFNLFLALSLTSCVKNMDGSYIPSYIHIDHVDVYTNSSQGSSSSYITDAWVYVDGADMGAYPLPASIPVLTEGEHNIKIAPGIKLNGVSGTRVPYPLMEPIEMKMNLVKDSIQPLNVQVKYFETSHFGFIEDFEDINSKFETTINNTATWRDSHSSTDPPEYIFEGTQSGIGILNDSNSYLQIITKQMFEDLPKKGAPVFIELDFKCNTTIVISIMSYNNEVGSSKDLIYLSPTDEWKKIYINLTTTLSYDVNTNRYKFLISAAHDSSQEESIVLIDNFKIIDRKIE